MGPQIRQLDAEKPWAHLNTCVLSCPGRREPGKQATLNFRPWSQRSMATSWFPVHSCKGLILSYFSQRQLNQLLGLACVQRLRTCFAWCNFTVCDLSSHFCLQAVGPENYLHFNYKCSTPSRRRVKQLIYFLLARF